MKKYIQGKSIEGNKVNDIKDLKGVSKAAWEFISSLYEAHWDNLVMDNKNTSLRNKVKSKFSPQAFSEPNNNKGKNVVNCHMYQARFTPGWKSTGWTRR